MNKEMKLATTMQVPVITANFDELRKKAELIANEYVSQVITEDSYKSAKADAKKLASMAKEVDSKRKEVKKALEQPIAVFEDQCKSVIQILRDAQKNIETRTDEYDEKIRQQKKLKAEKIIEEAAIKFGLTPKYRQQLVFKEEYSNLTKTEKSVREDVECLAVQLMQQQNTEAKLLAEGLATVEALNQTLENKMEISFFQKQLEQAVLNNPGGDNGWFVAQIREEGARRMKIEASIREKAEAEAKKKLEQEIAAKLEAEAEAKKQQVSEKQQAAETEIPVKPMQSMLNDEYQLSITLTGSVNFLLEIRDYLSTQAGKTGGSCVLGEIVKMERM